MTNIALQTALADPRAVEAPATAMDPLRLSVESRPRTRPSIRTSTTQRLCSSSEATQECDGRVIRLLTLCRYCDGSSHTSNAVAPVTYQGTTMWFRGRSNLAAIIAYLKQVRIEATLKPPRQRSKMQNHGLGNAKSLVQSGGSAGALSTYLGLVE
jgi:hypothetical protein